MKVTPTLLGVFMALFLLSVTAFGQVSIATAGPSGSYSQDFNNTFLGTASYSLADNAAANIGWYAFRTAGNVIPNSLAADTGSSTSGQLKNYGSTGSSDRALGSLATSGTGTVFYGLRVQNDTGMNVDSIHIQYTGEQWRAASTDADTLAFSYQVSPDDITSLTAGSWTNVAALSFASPNNTTSGAIDGNAAGNRATLDQIVNIAIPNGSEIMLRWSDIDDSGFDHGLAIDDVVVTLVAPVVQNVTISGRALTADGQGIGSVTIRLSGGLLTEPMQARTNPFGYYRFEDVPAGSTYLVEAFAKSYSFNTRMVNVKTHVTDLDFVALSP